MDLVDGNANPFGWVHACFYDSFDSLPNHWRHRHAGEQVSTSQGDMYLDFFMATWQAELDCGDVLATRGCKTYGATSGKGLVG